MKNNLNNRGMASIIEVIVTAVIFIIAAFGILTTASMLKPQSSASAKKLEAAYIGKAAIEELRSQVDAESWNDPQGPLATGQSYVETFGDYTVEYKLTEVPGTSVRQLEMAVKWPDENGALPGASPADSGTGSDTRGTSGSGIGSDGGTGGTSGEGSSGEEMGPPDLETTRGIPDPIGGSGDPTDPNSPPDSPGDPNGSLTHPNPN